MPRDFTDLKDGDVLEPMHINMIYRELRRWRRAAAVPPLVIDGIQSSDSGPVFRVSAALAAGWLAVANGAIPARSGTAAGIGSVYSVTAAPTYSSGTLSAVALSTDTTSYQVVNASSSTMTSGNGIDSGQYCWVQLGDDGLYYVSPLECS